MTHEPLAPQPQTIVTFKQSTPSPRCTLIVLCKTLDRQPDALVGGFVFLLLTPNPLTHKPSNQLPIRTVTELCGGVVKVCPIRHFNLQREL